MIAAGFHQPAAALDAMAALPQGRWFVWFEGQLAIEAHQSRDLRYVVEVINYLAHRGAVDCRQAPLDGPANQRRAWRHWIARKGDVAMSHGLRRAVITGNFTGGKRRDQNGRPGNQP